MVSRTSDFFKESKKFLDNNGLGIFLYPKLLGNKKHSEKILRKRHSDNQKKLEIFLILNDYEEEVKSFPNQILLRASARKSILKENEFVFPWMHWCKTEPSKPLAKGEKPRVGFCGSLRHKRIIYKKKFEHCRNLECDFILRDKFWGFANENKPEHIVQDYIKNIEDNHFNIGHRGRGNYSMRFYHTMAIGRIPITIDTDLSLPLEDDIDYSQFSVIEKNPRDLRKKIIKLHRENKLTKMQIMAGKIYHEKLNYKNYIINLFKNKKFKDKMAEFM